MTRSGGRGTGAARLAGKGRTDELERRARRIRETMGTMDDSLSTASPAPSCRSGDSGGEAALLNDYRSALAGAHAEIANLQAMLAQCSDYMERAEAKFSP